MNKEVFNYICKCEGWKTSIKSLHWDSKNLSQHKLCDDIADRLSDFQDQVSEVEQSISGNLPVNKLKGTEYKVTTLKKFVEDVINDTNSFYKKVKGMGDKYVGMASDCESFMSDMQRNLYLVNFTIKEDFKRKYRNSQKLMKENKQITLSEGQFQDVIAEAVKNVISRYGNVNEACQEAEVVGGEYDDKELNYTHFAVNKATNLIVDGWDYSGYDSEELKSYKRDYFYDDLESNGFNPKAYKILSFKACKRAGLDPNNQVNWSNTGVFPLFEEMRMKRDGENPFEIAMKRHPDWFVEE